MARFSLRRRSSDSAAKQGRVKQLWAVFQMTRRADPAVVWWMLLTFSATLLVIVLLGLLLDSPILFLVLGIPLAFMVALIVMARRAERAAFSQIAGQPGATLAAMRNLRRGWSVEQEPVAVDPRTQDLVFRAVGRPGVVLITEGPLPRVGRLADSERKRVTRVLPGVTVHVLHVGEGEGYVELRKLARTMTRLRPVLSKAEVGEVAKRLRALGGLRPPIPKGIDPTRVRPDRRATRGR
jgi:hypothetical protein